MDTIASSGEPKCAIEGCASKTVPLSEFPICEYHFRKIVKKYRTKVDEQERNRLAEDKARRARWAEKDERRRSWLRERSQVYYVRTGPNTIKIGFTAYLINRMQDYRLPLTHLLATEPGARAVEKERHQQFIEYRYGRLREDFIDAPELMAHIRLMRETHDTALTDNNMLHKTVVIPRLVASAGIDT